MAVRMIGSFLKSLGFRLGLRFRLGFRFRLGSIGGWQWNEKKF
jgi:hypothetical protein